MRKLFKILMYTWEKRRKKRKELEDLLNKSGLKLVSVRTTSIILSCLMPVLDKQGKYKIVDETDNSIVYNSGLTENEAAEQIAKYKKAAKNEGKTLRQYLDDLIEENTFPSKPKNSKPKGRKTKIPNNADEAETLSLQRENEAADILAKNGFLVEQNPAIKGTLRRPDYLIEGKIFDCYAPFNNNKPIRGIWKEVHDKVLKEQTQRVILNLKNWKGDFLALQKQFSDWKIENLKEVIYIDNSSIINYIEL